MNEAFRVTVQFDALLESNLTSPFKIISVKKRKNVIPKSTCLMYNLAQVTDYLQ